MIVQDRDPALHETSGGVLVGALLPPPELCLASQAHRSLSAYSRLEQSEWGRAFLPALPRSRVEGGRGGASGGGAAEHSLALGTLPDSPPCVAGGPCAGHHGGPGGRDLPGTGEWMAP